MEQLTFADGTEIAPAHIMEDDGKIWFYLENGISFRDAYALMADTGKTIRITAARYGEEKTYEGYTDLFCLRREHGAISGGLMLAEA